MPLAIVKSQPVPTIPITRDWSIPSLVNTELFPGREEFDCVLEELPSVIIYPLSNKGISLLSALIIK